MWENTRQRLEQLEVNLICKLCKEIVNEPHILGNCDHLFCRGCIGKLVGKCCPECKLPSFASDVRPYHCVAGIVRHCQELRKVIGDLEPSIPKIATNENSLNGTPESEASEYDAGDVLIVRNDDKYGSQAKAEQKLDATVLSPKSSPFLRASFSPKLSPSGSIINRRNAKGESPLHLAAIKGRLEEVARLLNLGANPNVKDHAGWTPLHEACNHAHAEIVKLLLDKGANINIPGCDNATPLHDAVNAGRHEIVKLLLSYGADLSCRNVKGYIPVDLAKDDAMKRILLSSKSETKLTPEFPVSLRVMTSELVLLGTGLEDIQKGMLENFAKLHRAKIVTDFSPEVTHLVAMCAADGTCPRTLKYLSAIVTGKWIVSFKWIEECAKVNKLLAEDAFEVNGTRQYPNCNGPKKGRINSIKQNPGLFSGCNFYFFGNYSPNCLKKSDLAQLVRLADGAVLVREPKLSILEESELTVPFHAAVGGSLENCCYYIIYQDTCKTLPIIYKSKYMRSLPLNWFLSCISKFELIESE